MESCSLQPSTITTVSTSITKSRFLDNTSIHGQILRFANFSKCPHATKIRTLDIKAQASGIAKFSSQAVEAVPEEKDLKDENLAYVAGATGRVGSRAVRELLKLGFRVRAGVRSTKRAETLVQSVKEMKLDGEGVKPVENLEIVECDLGKPKQIGPAVGNASVVLCCIGASEKDAFDITGPYRIDYLATKNLIDAAAAAKVNHFIMVSSLGTNKVGFPAAILNLFWGVLIWKRMAEEALIASGLPYTIVRPGGMERPTDSFKETHNITLSKEDTLFGGLVSNLQVAELMAFMAKNPRLSYCKVVEVIAETTAPLTPLDQLLAKIPYKRVPPKEVDAATEPEVAPAKNVVTEAPVTPIEKEPVEEKVTVTRPLSPYTAYDDLKPPTTPTPLPPSGQKQSANVVDAVPEPETLEINSSATASGIEETVLPALVEAKTDRPLSPYAAYDDLKPPTSPTPTPPSVLKQDANPADAAPKLEASDVETNSSLAAEPDIATTDPAPTEVKLETPLSPYVAYDDLKPPTTPSPTKPVGSVESIASTNGPAATASSDEEHQIEPKPRPLSPYAMYEDLKPPTSPIPSPRK